MVCLLFSQRHLHFNKFVGEMGISAITFADNLLCSVMQQLMLNKLHTNVGGLRRQVNLAEAAH